MKKVTIKKTNRFTTFKNSTKTRVCKNTFLYFLSVIAKT